MSIPSVVHILHGIHVSDPMRSIGKLKPCLEHVGFGRVIVEDYGFVLLGTAWLRNRSIAEKLLTKITPGGIIVAHSNGATITNLMLEMGLKISGAVLLNPALDNDKALPVGQVNWVHVYYNKDDHWTWISKFIPLHWWGNQGQIGYTGSDPRYTQFETGSTGMSLSDPHSGYWTDEKFPEWCPLLGKNTWEADLAYRSKAGLL